MTTVRRRSADIEDGLDDGAQTAEACSFCAEIDRSRHSNLFHALLGGEIGDEYVLEESDNFTVMPSVGALVPGYSLILPRRHLASFAHLPLEWHEELSILMEHVIGAVSGGISDFVVFEHGPVRGEHHSAGSCEDHAHLHVVPVPDGVDLMRPLSRDYRVRPIGRLADLRSQVVRRAPYLLLRTRDEMVVCDATRVPSQYFRRQLAFQLGRADEWDWAVFPQRRNILATIEGYRRPRS